MNHELNILTEAGIRPTANRILVTRELLASESPLSLTELETRIDTLDKSSVFRVLTLLLEHEVVHGVEDGRGVTRYEICHADHHVHEGDDHHHSYLDSDLHAHFHCQKCNRMFCFPQINTPQVELPDGFSAHSINFMIKGICPDCQR